MVNLQITMRIDPIPMFGLLFLYTTVLVCIHGELTSMTCFHSSIYNGMHKVVSIGIYICLYM